MNENKPIKVWDTLQIEPEYLKDGERILIASIYDEETKELKYRKIFKDYKEMREEINSLEVIE